MTEKEEKAVKQLSFTQFNIYSYGCYECVYSEDKEKNCINCHNEMKDIILNLIQKQQKALEQKDKEIQESKSEYYSLINKIENKIDKFDYEFEKAKRKNDNDRANYYWDLIGNFKKLLEVVK